MIVFFCCSSKLQRSPHIQGKSSINFSKIYVPYLPSTLKSYFNSWCLAGPRGSRCKLNSVKKKIVSYQGSALGISNPRKNKSNAHKKKEFLFFLGCKNNQVFSEQALILQSRLNEFTERNRNFTNLDPNAFV